MRAGQYIVCCTIFAAVTRFAVAEPLPSWNDSVSKQAIVAFVKKVTKDGSPDFVPPAQRIATFDNDGTLWAEQPVYFQLIFALDRVKQMAPDHPEWKTTEPFKSALAGDMQGLMATGKEGLAKIMAASHADITAEVFAASVHNWLETARHPKTGRRYDQMVYRPMLELLEFLRANGFKTYIVSGGGIDFMRVFAEKTYGIPPEQVVGSSIAARFEMRDGIPAIVKEPEGLFVDDKDGKPVGIYQHIGRRPIFAAGNSDGDLQMLQYTTIPRGRRDTTPRFGLIVHHTDAEREWAYDRESHIGQLNQALDEADQRGWTIVDMKADWNQIWPDSTASAAGAAESIEGQWQVEVIGGRKVVDNAHTTLQIAAGGTVTGDGGVNRYSGQAKIDGKSLTFGPMAATRRAGPPALMDQETKFFNALNQVKRYRIESSGRLSLLNDEGNELVRLSKLDAQRSSR